MGSEVLGIDRGRGHISNFGPILKGAGRMALSVGLMLTPSAHFNGKTVNKAESVVAPAKSFSINPECVIYEEAKVCLTATEFGVTATWTNDQYEVEYMYVFQAHNDQADGVNVREGVVMHDGSGSLTIDIGTGPEEVPAGEIIADATQTLSNGKPAGHGGIYNFYHVIGPQGETPQCIKDKTGKISGNVDGIISVDELGCDGYYIETSNGGLYGYGAAISYGNLLGRAATVSAAVASKTGGYWLLGNTGKVYSFGKADFEGSLADSKATSPVVGIASTPDDRGYWLATQNGGVYPFGDAKTKGSLLGNKNNTSPVVSIIADPQQGGYRLVNRKGGVYGFGGAVTYGSINPDRTTYPIVGMAPTVDGLGYWLTTKNGGVYPFGDAQFKGSLAGQKLKSPVVGIAEVATGGPGYYLAEQNGSVINFGNAVNFGGSLALESVNKSA
jgi:hypothetical protein